MNSIAHTSEKYVNGMLQGYNNGIWFSKKQHLQATYASKLCNIHPNQFSSKPIFAKLPKLLCRVYLATYNLASCYVSRKNSYSLEHLTSVT